MTDSVKFIVGEINRTLKSDYNLITFDALSVENLLQVLVDVLHHVGALVKFNVKDTDPADTNRHILDALKKIQYRPGLDDSDPTAFRRQLLQGDRKAIYPILQFVFENTDRITNLTYLAQFLMPINLPAEAMANADIAALWSDYTQLMQRFKEEHRNHSESKRDSEKFRELRQDIGIIESEKENVKKRLERTQSRLDKIPQQELLIEAAQALRIERERKKELQSQLEEQQQSAHMETHMTERLQKELNSATAASQDTSPQNLLDALLEETQVMQFMVAQKLPQEIAAKQSEIQILEQVVNHPNVTREYLLELQEQVDKVSTDVQRIAESQIQVRGTHAENLVPFRQQAASVQRNKDLAAEQLDQSSKELRDIETQLQQKQNHLRETVGGMILRGEELKQYVNMLRAKSSVYKQQRAELASLKAEATDLQQTLDSLKQQDPTLQFNLAEDTLPSGTPESLGEDSAQSGMPIEKRGVTELSRLVDGLTRAVVSARERVTPLSQQLMPLRSRVADLKDERDSAMQAYNSLVATLTTETAVVQNIATDLNNDIRKLETTWKDLQSEHDRIETLLAKVQDDNEDAGEGDSLLKRTTLREVLAEQLREQEALAERLRKENEMSRSEKGNAQQQMGMWSDLSTLLDVKLQCIRDAQQAGAGGTLLVQKGGAETFTLQ